MESRNGEEGKRQNEENGNVDVKKAYTTNYSNNKGYYKKEKLDPYTIQMMIYKAEMYILMRYPFLIDINKKNEKISKLLDDNSMYFVIKALSEEDIHKGIKYNLWCSTKNGNQTLNNAFKKSGDNVILFFTCKNSNRFTGVARMKSGVHFDKIFPLWTKDNKWGGLFEMEWIFIKDVPNREFKDVIITMTDGIQRPVNYSRDSQEVSQTEGKKMIEIFENYLNSNSILEHFEYYDIRQENYERTYPVQMIQYQLGGMNLNSEEINKQTNEAVEI